MTHIVILFVLFNLREQRIKISGISQEKNKVDREKHSRFRLISVFFFNSTRYVLIARND